ncbi:dymeclin isoform X2 [Sitodiplosis mosellana]|uniref:dymeclin isoform X2 n=1 Tax=Sitodiplosis mosellana TaxID=263140 RepID=UPI0024446FD9|nr:dymeclin isoform X2 [Sitodiplosis mosellana]XP_055316229.1 dymeclin isoform X2 [Sitodiplosis mosellana]XP_055316230.1 dymeclin isoform X2 [Sitodiplosis mosellana]XP_055316231.1 dymeclin isoform X2 [Sitodiplosis mosellana]
MGINISRQTDLSENTYLNQFVGKNHIPATNNEFWNSFLQYQIALPTNSEEQLSLDSRLETMCQQFISHNLATGNFGSLITIFLNKVSELLELSDKDSMHIWQTFNALFIIRCTVKYLIETGSEYQLLQHFEAMPSTATEIVAETSNGTAAIDIDTENKTKPVRTVDGSKFETFFEAVVNLLIIIPVKEFTYHLHLEAVNLLIVLLSVHLFSQQPTEKSIIFRTVYNNPNANTLMSALLHFVSRMVEEPPTMFGINSGGSLVFGIAESLLSIFTFRKTHQDFLSSNDLPMAFKEHYPLANQSLLLILILTNHCTATSKNNKYRQSLFGCCDSKDSPKDGHTFKIDFTALFNTLCKIVTIDQATLLLYLLLHRNQQFYQFAMAQENLQQMVIPILQTLYNAPDSTSHHIYMTLIVLLILSEDDGFNKSVHQITLKNIHWYTERTISEISLGGLLILVVIRTIQYNMLKMRDKYLHTNCLAALANMSGQFRQLHPYTAQRLVSLFETLAKKHARLYSDMNGDSSGVGAGSSSSSTASTVIPVDATVRSMVLEDLSVLEEVLRMVLEIINSCISHQLVYCPNLVYTLLYKRQVFESFRSNPAFQDIIQNIDMVVGFFSSRLQRVQDQRGELGVGEVLEVISKGASQWSSDRLRKFPDLKFRYVEEDAPEEFFIPYVWSLVTKYGSLHFNSEIMKGLTSEINC